MRGFKGRHRFGASSVASQLQVVQIAVECQQTTTGGATELDAELFEGGTDPVGSQFGIFRQFFDFLNGFQGGFLDWVVWSGGLIVQPGELFFGPATGVSKPVRGQALYL